MPLNILAIGDAHFKTSNIKEVDDFLIKLESFLEEHKGNIDICVNLGDTLHEHSRLHIAPLNKAIKYTELLSRYAPTYVIIGNHCSINNSIFLSTDHWANCLKGWKNVTVVDKVIVDVIKGVKLGFCPYVPDGRFIEALNTVKDEWKDCSVIFSHITITGADMGTAIATSGTKWNSEFPLLVCGHIHKSQWIGENMYYTGSAMQVDINESPDKHICIVNINDNINIEEHDIGIIRKKIIELSIENIDEFNLQQGGINNNIQYTLYITGTYEQIRAFRKSDKYKRLNRNVRISFRPSNTQIQYKQVEKSFDQLITEGIVGNRLLESFYLALTEGTEDISDNLDKYLII